MVVKKSYFVCFFTILLVFSIFNLVSAFEFNGTVYDVNGNPLNNSVVNITIWTISQGPTFVGSNSTTTNASGWFNMSVSENSSWMYKPIVMHTNSTLNSVDWVSQPLPIFPLQFFSTLSGIDFYLKEAATINITAINRSGGYHLFQYMLKDTSLGYAVAEEFSSYSTERVVYVPKERNYSIMIYPFESMPINYDWNNFSSTSSYDLADGLSNYNATTKTLHKQFNITSNVIRVAGYAFNSSDTCPGYDEFIVMPFLLEPGNMVYISNSAGTSMPFNMSAWAQQSDLYNNSLGYYNISLVGSPDPVSYMLFATARNGSDYYGGYKNVSISYSSPSQDLNFTMYPLMSTDWGSSNSNISMWEGGTGAPLNKSTARFQLNLVNSSDNVTYSNIDAHIEAKVDYSDYNSTILTFTTGISSSEGSFYLPLLNVTGIEEVNIYSMDYAPRRIGKKSSSQLLSNPNITLSEFDPGEIPGQEDIDSSSISIGLYHSNATCDVPNPPSACSLADSSTMDEFNPLTAIIGGGDISFRMGLSSSGILVHYVKVDLIASGPPDAAFDDQATTSTSGSFESAMRFGSQGPTIYDYVLISIPYTQGSSSQTGLNENNDVNISIPLFYDEDWNIIWNTTNNGTSGSDLASNNSHYSLYSTDWETLMSQNNCTRNQSQLNSTNPCYLDTTNNRIWIRLPHFSGTQPSVIGDVITATSNDNGNGGGGGGGGGVSNVNGTKSAHTWSKITPGAAEIWKFNDLDLGLKQISITVNNPAQTVKITVTKYDGLPAEVTKEKTGNVYNYFHIGEQNLGENMSKAVLTLKVNKSWLKEHNLTRENIALFKFNESSKEWMELLTTYKEEDSDNDYYDVGLSSFSYFAIAEKEEIASPETTPTSAPAGSTIPPTTPSPTEEEKSPLIWLWVVLVVVVVVVMIGLVVYLAKNKKKNKKATNK